MNPGKALERAQVFDALIKREIKKFNELPQSEKKKQTGRRLLYNIAELKRNAARWWKIYNTLIQNDG